MPIAPTVGAALVTGGASLAANLLGGLFGSKSQSAANATNLQIARENNQTSLEVARQNNQMSYDMFMQQLQYASPAEQRRMLEEAGYNPNLYALGSSASLGSIPSMSQPNLQAPQVIPEDAFARSIGNSITGAADNLKTIAEAEFARQQARQKTIENAVWETKLYNDLVGQGLSNDWQRIQNYIADNTSEDLINAPALQNELLHSQWKLTEEQYNLAVIESALRKEYGSSLSQAELEKKAAEAFAAWQKGWLDQGELAHIDEKYKSMLMSAQASLSQAETAKLRVPAQNAADYASARYQNSVAAFNEYDLDYMQSLGLSKLASETQKLRSEYDLNMKKGKSEVENRELIKALHDKYQAEIDILITNGKYQEAQNLSTIFSKIVGSLTGAAGAAGSLMPQ